MCAYVSHCILCVCAPEDIFEYMFWKTSNSLCHGDSPCVAAGLKKVDSSYMSDKEVSGLDYRKGIVTTLSTHNDLHVLVCM